MNTVLQSGSNNPYENQSLTAFNNFRIAETVSSQIQIPPTINETILEKNRRFWLTRFIFNKTFLEQSLEIFKLYDYEGDSNYEAAKGTDLQ